MRSVADVADLIAIDVHGDPEHSCKPELRQPIRKDDAAKLLFEQTWFRRAEGSP